MSITNPTNTRVPEVGEANWISEAGLLADVLCVQGDTVLCQIHKTDGSLSNPTSQYWNRWTYAEPQPAPVDVPTFWVEWRTAIHGEKFIGSNAMYGVMPENAGVATEYAVESFNYHWVIVDPSKPRPLPAVRKGQEWVSNNIGRHLTVISDAMTSANGSTFFVMDSPSSGPLFWTEDQIHRMHRPVAPNVAPPIKVRWGRPTSMSDCWLRWNAATPVFGPSNLVRPILVQS